MAKKEIDKAFENLPAFAAEYIKLVIRKMGYRRKVREEVREELVDHFETALKDCATDAEKEQKAQKLISEFGDAKLLAKLMRRAKKRCRPLWQKIIVRGSVVTLIIFAYLFICGFWLRIGRPTIKINYAQWLTDQQRQGRDESLNAKPDMDKAAKLIRDSNGWINVYDVFRLRLWPQDMNDSQRTVVTNYLTANDKAIDIFNTALEKPYFWTDYNSAGPIIIEANSVLSVNPDFIYSIHQPLGLYRLIAQILYVRINQRVYSGDIDGAVDDIISLLNLSFHLEQQDFLVHQLVATAIESLEYNQISMVLSRMDIPSEQLKRLQDELTINFKEHEFPINLNGEKVFWYALVQQGFTDNGKGSGKMLRAGTIYFVHDWKDAIWSFLTFRYPDRQEALAHVDKMFAEVRKNFQITPWQRKAKIPKFTFTSVQDQIINPNYERIAYTAWRLKTHREAVLTILAVLRYQKEKGKYPDNLDDLVKTGYLIKLPEDPFGSGPLSYKKTTEGFMLYSWGSNLKDDDGQAVREKGKIRQWADEGDWVFWPVEKK
ncbi:MAG: hypothetical protein ABSB91_06650 [Sedimentisphaerales bacterium]